MYYRFNFILGIGFDKVFYRRKDCEGFLYNTYMYSIQIPFIKFNWFPEDFQGY